MPSGICIPDDFTTFDTEILTTDGIAAFAAGAIVTRLGPSFASASLRLICEAVRGNPARATARPPPTMSAHNTATRVRFAAFQNSNDFTLPPGFEALYLPLVIETR